MDENILKLIKLIEASELDETIKSILIRDLQNEGMTDFLKEQIKAYCLEGLKDSDSDTQAALKILEGTANE
jgi:pimeloyl-CoA synthetase